MWFVLHGIAGLSTQRHTQSSPAEQEERERSNSDSSVGSVHSVAKQLGLELESDLQRTMLTTQMSKAFGTVLYLAPEICLC